MTPRAARFATWRGRLPVVAVVVACVAGVVAAVSGAANPVSAVQFLLPGHWVYNDALGMVFHVDGSSGNVDARARVPGNSGDQVFQGDTSGYVVGDSRITEFGRSTLEVEETRTPVSRTTPVGVETAGGPYLVYRPDGKVVRLGEDPLVVSLGGPIGTPVATRDGTLWLPRTSAGLLCRLSAGATSPSCGIALPKGHAGALTVVGDKVMFVDTTADTLHVVERDGLGAGRDLGVDAADDARLAATDVRGRVVILDGQRMHLVDTAARPADTETVDLGEGDFDGPVSTGEVVAVVDKRSNTLITYGSDGKHKESTSLPPEDGDPRLTLGEDDRIYVDGDEGEHVVVVDKDGDRTDVPIKDEGAEKDTDRETPPRGGADPDQPPAGQPDEDRPPATERPDQTQQRQPPNKDQKPPAQERTPPPAVPATPPGAPTGVTATAADSAATVSWGAAPANRAPITGYTISWAGGRTTALPGARSVNIGSLVNGTTYVFTVTATNAKGTGPGASSNPVTPVAPFRPAAAPTNLTGTNDYGNSTVSASWSAPADMGTGPFVHYVVDVVDVRNATVTGTSVTFDDIQVDSALTITVTAVTTDPGGQQVAGQPAQVTTDDPGGTPTVTLSQGEPTEEYCGELEGCAWMHVVAAGFPPETMLEFQPHSSDPRYENGGHETPTNADGYADIDQFAYAGVSHKVWVTVTLPDGTTYDSNRITWGAG